MGIIGPHHLPDLFQNWSTDGREISHFRGAEGGFGAGTDVRSDVVPVDVDDELVTE